MRRGRKLRHDGRPCRLACRASGDRAERGRCRRALSAANRRRHRPTVLGDTFSRPAIRSFFIPAAAKGRSAASARARASEVPSLRDHSMRCFRASAVKTIGGAFFMAWVTRGETWRFYQRIAIRGKTHTDFLRFFGFVESRGQWIFWVQRHLYCSPVEVVRIHTNPKRQRGNDLGTSLTLRVSVSRDCEQYMPLGRETVLRPGVFAGFGIRQSVTVTIGPPLAARRRTTRTPILHRNQPVLKDGPNTASRRRPLKRSQRELTNTRSPEFGVPAFGKIAIKAAQDLKVSSHAFPAFSPDHFRRLLEFFALTVGLRLTCRWGRDRIASGTSDPGLFTPVWCMLAASEAVLVGCGTHCLCEAVTHGRVFAQ